MKIAATVLVGLAVVAALVIGLTQAGSRTGSEPSTATGAPTAAQASRFLQGSPAALAALHAQGSEILPGGPAGLKERMRALRGFPLVINVWASWCGPCRQEMPVLQKVSVSRGRKIAFLGVNLKDNTPAARRLLREFPVAYPSYQDPDGKIYNANRLAGAPSMLFYSASGKRQYIHSGPYLSTKDLNVDIDRYAVAPK
ncbi:MAG: redoxin family protein [Actinobacteria bacterium]|uniref:Unannotated protein n=1 Tax=freshwater metagenome TaxID=449393 RepID=A0A6J5YTH8_9ZZZZ|nr:redoxin family protein [Actinomycetota bacterium]